MDPATPVSNIRADSIATWDAVTARYIDISETFAATTYTKAEVDGQLATKAAQATTYTKAEVDGQLATKAAQASTYTKAEVDQAVALKQDALTFTAPLSLSGTTLGVDFTGNNLMGGSLEVVNDGIFLEDLYCGATCSVTGALEVNTLSNLDSGGTNPPITVTSDLELTGDLSVDTIRTAGGLTLDTVGVVVKGDLAVDNVLLAPDIHPRSSGQMNLNSNVVISGDLAVTWGPDRAVGQRSLLLRRARRCQRVRPYFSGERRLCSVENEHRRLVAYLCAGSSRWGGLHRSSNS